MLNEKIKSQRVDVLAHLRKYGSITNMEAFQRYGATRLGSIIYDLRKYGYNISTFMVESKNRYGKLTQYAKYVLEEE